ncbi:putative sulfate exporter family transporter [Halostagnicola sp. A-GB9-2]|uniref:YeiH family protein n=1 Tax=Halostagnicola sp. A-GB9-2 TaxID=3048066 RepID=UPI0024C04E38|nr:putative sulfate exporter family transporter [Halostagnicola sp. A-GB9-2]MDJ1433144.1 putative sulfate exporter family transporter [Halostagnicola sp. A-GB9-2]
MDTYRVIPGIGFLCVGAVLARSLELVAGFNHLLVAIGIGFVLANSIGIPDRLGPGIATHKLWLGAGIVLMGASLTLDTILEVGATIILVVALVTTSTILVVEVLSRNVFGLATRLGSLLAAGASICGVSAVVAVAGSIDAREDQIAYAAATVLLFDAFTIVVYPIIGELLELSGTIFGIWAGVSMFSTGPVVAVGFAHSEAAGQWATMTKLSRNALIGFVVLGYATYYAGSGTNRNISVRTLWDEFPKFVLGFLVLVLVASAGIFSQGQQRSIENAYNWLFVLAFVGLGTEIQLNHLRSTGMTPALVVFLALIVSSSLSLAVLLILL